MNPEKFNPSNPEYKEVNDLPKNQQENFTDVSGGFVRKEVLENQTRHEEDAKEINKLRSGIDKLFGRKKVLADDRLINEATDEDMENSMSGTDHEFGSNRRAELINLYPEIGPVLRELESERLTKEDSLRIISEFNDKYGMTEKKGLYRSYRTEPLPNGRYTIQYFIEGTRRVRIGKDQ